MPTVSEKQHAFMVKACKSKAFADAVGISQEVACEFVAADKARDEAQEQQDAKAGKTTKASGKRERKPGMESWPPSAWW